MKNRLFFRIAAIFAGLFIFAVIFFKSRGDVYKTIYSPDRQFRLVVTKNQSVFSVLPVFPGGGGDFPGVVTVSKFTAGDWVELNSTSVEMVNIIDQVDWSSSSEVWIKGVGRMPLQ